MRNKESEFVSIWLKNWYYNLQYCLLCENIVTDVCTRSKSLTEVELTQEKYELIPLCHWRVKIIINFGNIFFMSPEIFSNNKIPQGLSVVCKYHISCGNTQMTPHYWVIKRHNLQYCGVFVYDYKESHKLLLVIIFRWVILCCVFISSAVN